MANYAYIRVSTADQCEDRQVDAMQSIGIHTDKIYIDKQSGKNTKRPQLQALLRKLCKGDTVTAESLSRFARSTRDLLDLVELLREREVEFISLKESIDSKTPTGKLMLTVFAAIYEFERECTLERQAEGIAAAKARGKHLGRAAFVPPDNLEIILCMVKNGEISIDEACIMCGGVSKSTYYRIARNYWLQTKKNL